MRTVFSYMFLFLLLCEAFSELYRFRSRIIDIRIRSGPEWEVFRDIISFDLAQAFQYIRLPIDRTRCIDLSVLVPISRKLVDGVVIAER